MRRHAGLGFGCVAMGAAACVACASGTSPGGQVNAAGTSTPDANAESVDSGYVFIDAAPRFDARSEGEVDASDPPPPPPDAALPPDAARPIDASPPPDAPGGSVVVFGPGADTAQHGNTAGGTAFNDVCPSGQALIGLAGSLRTTSGYHGKIAGACGLVTLAGSGASATVVVTSGETLPTRGLIGSAAWDRTCPADHLLVGFGGRAGSLVDQLVLRCAALTVGGEGTALSLGAVTDLEPVGGGGGDLFSQTDCPAPQVAVGVAIRAGDGIDAFGLRCGVPTAP